MRHTDPNKKLDKLLIEQSSELFEAAQRGGEQEQHALADWLLQSKRHVRTHLFVAALEEELKHIDPERRIPIPNLRTNAASVTALKSQPQIAVTNQSRPWVWAIAATVF